MIMIMIMIIIIFIVEDVSALSRVKSLSLNGCTLYTGLQKETANLKALCANKGATEEELAICKPRRRSQYNFTPINHSLPLYVCL